MEIGRCDLLELYFNSSLEIRRHGLFFPIHYKSCRYILSYNYQPLRNDDHKEETTQLMWLPLFLHDDDVVPGASLPGNLRRVKSRRRRHRVRPRQASVPGPGLQGGSPMDLDSAVHRQESD